MTAYDTVIFDSDGVLVEPPAYETQAEATRAAFRAVGIEDVDRQSVDDVVAGVTVDRLREICVSYDLDETTLWEAREDHDERSQFERFRAGDRTRYDDVVAIADLDEACGVVSNNHHSTIEFVLDFFDLEPLFGTYYGRPKTIESLERKKPEPYYLERALDDLDGESALYVGDSESDVIAARRAGLDSAFVRRSHCRDAVLSTTPTYEVTTLHEIADLVAD
ncbi:HAD family hydrolase [Halosolutus gelatinilyticus]|uniref:HAD family hydrolase n=1 Tax=Halosolutus gelatinilyticus TaxID=2931975 RepID=UPI001FF4094E|nr:HAD family hydrolase [Halosolutus gelatinilyticus]